MGEVANLPLNAEREITHRTLSVEVLGRLLAEAEEIGYRRALIDANVEVKTAHRLRTNHAASYNTRCDLFAAIWRRAGKGI